MWHSPDTDESNALRGAPTSCRWNGFAILLILNDMPDTLFPCPVPVRTHTHLANIISFHRVTHWLLLQLRAYRAPQTTMNRNGRRGSALRNYLLLNRAVKWMGLWLVPVRVSKHDELNWKLATKKTRTDNQGDLIIISSPTRGQAAKSGRVKMWQIRRCNQQCSGDWWIVAWWCSVYLFIDCEEMLTTDGWRLL